MKDLNRIHRILDKIATIWTSAPDVRLGQLLYTVSHNEPGCGAQWYTEDEALEAALDKWLAAHPQPTPGSGS